ncbi:MAG: hypothetical protein JKY71_10565 [Alphaproteobacteria bacterium]|nr:hypothetical protein [Alphaproteobacteria bacterium]
MRKRYQKIDRGLGVSRAHGDEVKKEAYDPYTQDKYKQAADRYDPVQETNQGLKQKLQIDMSDTDIPPQMQRLLRLMLVRRQEQKKSPTLLKVMVILVMITMGTNLILTGNGGIGDFAKDAFNFVFIFGIIAAVIIPVGFISWKLESVMSKDNAARVGATIILGLIFAFFWWLASNWGGGY